MRKTKIICTLGPATDDEKTLEAIALAGMNVARFNFSHGDHASHLERFQRLVHVREKHQLPIATLLDTKGPEIRIGTFQTGKATLKAGNPFMLTTRQVTGDDTQVHVNYADLPADIRPGAAILLDDGLVALKVDSIADTDIHCTVLNDGVISDRKGVNCPGTELSMPYISDRDRADILFGIEHGFDFVAASFARTADDVLEIRKLLDEHGCHDMDIIAKIENAQGVANIDDIIRVADGIMVARGDMGVEIPLEDVPVLQKLIIKKAFGGGKRVITATQMLDSMMKNPRPTRAEATDVANAIYDGTSAIMLSGETAAGLYPVEAVKTMARIALRAEEDIDYIKRFQNRVDEETPNVTNAISHATCTSAHDLGAAAIITVTKSGKTARMISKFRPRCPIIGCATEERVYRKLNLSWGVTPVMIQEESDTDDLFEHAVAAAQKTGIVSDGDLVVITAGVPLGVAGTTNMMKVHVVGHILLTGTGVGNGAAGSTICVCQTAQEAFELFNDGDILVIPETSNELLPILKKASGIITEVGGLSSHAAVVGLALDIPVLVGAQYATQILKSGAFITLDAARGVVHGDAK